MTHTHKMVYVTVARPDSRRLLNSIEQYIKWFIVEFDTRLHTFVTRISTTDGANTLPGKAVSTYFYQLFN